MNLKLILIFSLILNLNNCFEWKKSVSSIIYRLFLNEFQQHDNVSFSEIIV